MKIPPRVGLFGSIFVCLAIYLVACGCASTEKQTYVDWLAIRNPAALCNGQADCVQRSTYRGKPLCTIVTADKDVSYARLGEQVRQCLM